VQPTFIRQIVWQDFAAAKLSANPSIRDTRLKSRKHTVVICSPPVPSSPFSVNPEGEPSGERAASREDTRLAMAAAGGHTYDRHPGTKRGPERGTEAAGGEIRKTATEISYIVGILINTPHLPSHLTATNRSWQVLMHTPRGPASNLSLQGYSSPPPSYQSTEGRSVFTDESHRTTPIARACVQWDYIGENASSCYDIAPPIF
jgi:hypothetical protein